MSAPAVPVLAWRALRRDARGGELRLLFAALVLAVAAMACVGFLADRMRQALSAEATQLLGADWVLNGDRAFEPALVDRVRGAGLQAVRSVNFPSMSIAGERTQLVSLRAVDAGYPLRGALRIRLPGAAQDEVARGLPAPGTVWVDPQLLDVLGLAMGDEIQLGESRFKVAAVVTAEPDRGASFVNFAPRVILGWSDLAATELLQPASRATWRLMVAGEPQVLKRFVQGFEPAAGQRVETLEEGRPELRNTLDRAERFLSLVALLSALIAAVAIALAARRFAQKQVDAFAVMRALGLTQARLAGLLATEMLYLGLAGAAGGLLLGLAAQQALASVLQPLVGLPLPMPGPVPALQAAAAGLLLLAGFAVLPVTRLARVPALRVLRRDLGAPPLSAWATGAAALVCLALLVRWFAGDDRLAGLVLVGFAGGAALFALAAWALVRGVGLLRRVPGGQGGWVGLAIAAWSRRQGSSVTQTVALAVALMALMLLTVVRSDLLEGWRRASPADAPNRFVINIQPEQVAPIDALLKARAGTVVDLYPMVRGRLVTVNGEAVDGTERGERARRMLDREFNLSYADTQPSHNVTVAGRWLDPAKPEVSVEQGIAFTLGLGLGDRVGFDVAGQTVEATITGIRKLAWDSMKVNFFMILSPAALADAPRTHITAFHLPAGREDVQRELLSRFPNLTVFDTGNLLRQVQTMLDQVSRAVEFLFLFTLAAGVLVLYAALVGSRDERLQEAALLRALGASRRQLARGQLLELCLAGGLAGLLAAAAAMGVGDVIAAEVFRFDFSPRWSLLPIGLTAGAACALSAGWLGLRGILDSPPVATLRG